MSRGTWKSVIALAAVGAAISGCGSKKSGGVSACGAPVPTKWDSDGDLLSDIQEAKLGTDPHKADTDGDGFSDYVEVNAGTDPLDKNSKPSGAVSDVHQIADASELIGGPAAQAKVGDWLLQNDRIRVIVQDVTALQQQLGTFGGNLLDGDVVRPANEPGNDTIGMVIPLMNLGYTSHPDKVVVVNDGSDGGAAILRTCGAGDTYQYLDLTATFAEFGFTTAIDTNAIFPTQFSNDYILAPGSDVVEIVTTIGNQGKTIYEPVGDVIDSGGAQEIFNTNYIGFGQAGFGALASVQPSTNYLGFQSPGSAWGYVNDADPNVSVTISGVTVIEPEFKNIFDAITANPASGARDGFLTIPGGGRASYHRGIRITDGTGGLEPIADLYYQRHNPTAVAHSGTVTDGTGPLAGARITALTDSAGNAAMDLYPIESTESDASGNYTLTLPPGKYYIAADYSGRNYPTISGAGVTATTINTRYTQTTNVPAGEVTFAASEAAPDFTFDDFSHLKGHVFEAGYPANTIFPARITVVGSDPSPGDSIFRDQKEAVSSSVAANVLTKTGDFDIPIEPGGYTVYADHGIEFSIDSAGVAVPVGGTNGMLNLTVGRVIDSTGWISADFHVHMINSPDSPVPFTDRVLNAATEGLDVLVATDHDYITDLAPIAASMGLSTSLATVPGEEITTWDMGHFNMWPLAYDPAHPADGGAYKWSGDGNNNPISNKPLKKIFEDMEARFPGAVKQVNHPRSGGGTSTSSFILQQYYSAIKLDTTTLKSKQDPAFLRIPDQGGTADDTKLFYDQYDAQEVQNGFDAPNVRWADLNDLMTMLSHGMTLAGTGNSDTHKVFSNQLGYPRNFVKISDDDPGHLSSHTAEFAKSIVDGHTFFSQGPFLRVQVTGSGGVVAEAGDMVKPKGDGTVAVDVTVEWPTWIGIDHVHIYSNTPNTTTPAGNDGNPTQPAAYFTYSGFSPTLVTGTNGLDHFAIVVPTQNVTIPSGKDAWILVDADAETSGTRSMFPIIPIGTNDATGVHPYALYNAIFVDGNGNGTYDAPGVAFTANYVEPKAVPKKTWSWREVPLEGTPEIRAQFDAIAKGACRGEETNGKKGNLDHAE